jgi:hypothetical protein
MFRSTLFVFIVGWILWFWIDKPDPRNFRMPPPGDSMIGNFQAAFNMLKGGYPEASFLFIWNAHYLVLSLLGGLILLSLLQSISGLMRRRRMRKDYLPPKREIKLAQEAAVEIREPEKKDLK